MASEKIIAQKQAQVEELVGKLKNSVAGVLVDYSGISVADDTKLRKELREAGVHYEVVKNSIIERAAKEVGFEELNSHLHGSSALAISSEDPVAAAKIISKYAKDHKDKFTVKAGYVDGGVIDAAKVAELGSLPSREGLLSMLLSVLTGNLRGLAVALNAIAEKNGEEAPAEAEAPVAEAPAEA